MIDHHSEVVESGVHVTSNHNITLQPLPLSVINSWIAKGLRVLCWSNTKYSWCYHPHIVISNELNVAI